MDGPRRQKTTCAGVTMERARILQMLMTCRQQAEQSVRQQLGDAVAATWNALHEAQGSFADEYPTL